MRRSVWAFVLLVGVASGGGGTSARAQTLYYQDARALAGTCAAWGQVLQDKAKNQLLMDAATHCLSYVKGTVDALIVAKRICVPLEVKTKQLLELSSKALVAEGTAAPRPAGEAIEKALVAAYPCPAK